MQALHMYQGICSSMQLDIMRTCPLCESKEETWRVLSDMPLRYMLPTLNPFPKQALVFMCLQYKSFENTVSEGEIACDEQFLLFPVFSNHWDNFLPFPLNFKFLSANSFSLEMFKICCFGKG